MRADLPDWKALAAAEAAALGKAEVDSLLDRGREFGSLGPTLRDGGALLFPHIGLATGGHLIAAAIHGALDSGAERVLVVGVLHARTDALEEARVRVAEGGDPAREPAWGIQGPGIPDRSEWETEFSLDHFLFLWKAAAKRKLKTPMPRLVLRFPYLAGGRPERMPGIGKLEEMVEGAYGGRDPGPATVVLATGDLFHHGIAYGDPPDASLDPGDGGLDAARRSIERGLRFLRDGDHLGYQRHSIQARSDARDVGQVLGHLLGPLEGRILDLVAEDMTGPYRAAAPSWVAGALVELRAIEPRS